MSLVRGLTLRLTGFQPALRNWRLWFAAAVLCELGWVGLMHPLVPKTLGAGLVLALLPLTLVGYVYVVARLLVRLADAHWNLRVRRLIALALALSVGGFLFVLLWVVEASGRPSATVLRRRVVLGRSWFPS